MTFDEYLDKYKHLERIRPFEKNFTVGDRFIEGVPELKGGEYEINEIRTYEILEGGKCSVKVRNIDTGEESEMLMVGQRSFLFKLN